MIYNLYQTRKYDIKALDWFFPFDITRFDSFTHHTEPIICYQMSLSPLQMTSDPINITAGFQITHPEQPSHQYTIVREVGRGSFAVCFEAIQKETQKQFALKLLPISGFEELSDTLNREIYLLSAVKHPFILQYQEFFFYEFPQRAVLGKVRYRKYLVIVLEFCVCSLEKKVLGATAQVADDIVTSYIFQTLIALHHLHRKGIFHRDVKPENVLIGVDGNVRLADFGLAKKFGSGNQTLQKGTPYYMANELYSRQEYDDRVDVWAAGVMSYYLASCGEYPFDGTDVPLRQQVRQCYYNRDLVSLSKLAPVIERFLVSYEDRPHLDSFLHENAGYVLDLLKAHPRLIYQDFPELYRKLIASPTMMTKGHSYNELIKHALEEFGSKGGYWGMKALFNGVRDDDFQLKRDMLRVQEIDCDYFVLIKAILEQLSKNYIV